MSTMGGSCSIPRGSRWCNYDQEHRGNNEENCASGRIRQVRHSVESELPDKSICHLYPLADNYVISDHKRNRRSPKSLVELCVDTVCRSLPNLDGDLPSGLPEEIVNKIVKSLVDHAALNATTLRALRNCEIGQLSLAGCRGVRDDWLSPLANKTSGSDTGEDFTAYSFPNSRSGSYCQHGHHDYTPLLSSTDEAKSPFDFAPVQNSTNNFAIGNLTSSGSILKESFEEEVILQQMDENSTSSRSTSSFVSASSTLYNMCPQPNSTNCQQKEEITLISDAKVSVKEDTQKFCASSEKKIDKYVDEHHSNNTKDDISNPVGSGTSCQTPPCNIQMSLACPSSPSCYHKMPSFTSTLQLLDVSNSQRLTDRGLLQLHQLTNLEVAKLDNCHSLTGRGLTALSNSHRLHTLSLVNCRRLTDEATVNISHLIGLEALVLEGCRCLTDASLDAISNLRFLRRLDLSQCDLITNEALAHLRPLEYLEELFLGWCRKIDDIGLEILCDQPSRNTNLKVLRLARLPVTEMGMKDSLSKLTALEELDLNGCSHISSSDDMGKTLAKLVKLKVLDVSYCPGILRSSWQNKVNSLRSLFLNYSGVRDSHLARFTNLPALEELILDSCPVGDWAVAHLADNGVTPNLTSLDLADTDLSDMGMAHLPKFTKMTKLSLFYCNISNAGLRHLSEMENLEVLNLDSRDIGDEGLTHLRNLKRLRCLDLFSGRVTDAGCAHLSVIMSLESLELCGGGVGDLGCANLAKLDNLTSLNLSQNERITNRGAAALAALSNLKALNLSNTRVTSASLRFLGGLLKLQSLALYGCHGIDDADSLTTLQSELPSLKCLRLNGKVYDDDEVMSTTTNGEGDDEDLDDDSGEDYDFDNDDSSDDDGNENGSFSDASDAGIHQDEVDDDYDDEHDAMENIDERNNDIVGDDDDDDEENIHAAFMDDNADVNSDQHFEEVASLDDNGAWQQDYEH